MAGTTTVTVMAQSLLTDVTCTLNYKLDNGSYQASNVFTGVSGGNHTICVAYATSETNAADEVYATAPQCSQCESCIPITIPQPTPIGITYEYTEIKCNGGTTTLTIHAMGGQPPYQYNLDGGAYQGSNVFNNVSGGNHTVCVKDSLGCNKCFPVTIVQPTPIEFDEVVVTSPSCSSQQGSVFVKISGGTPEYDVSIDGHSAFTTDGQATINNIPPGTYTLSATDAHGCTKVYGQITINPAPAFSITAEKQDNTGCGEYNGFIKVSVTGGVPPFTYYLADGISQTFETSDPTHTFENLPDGAYRVWVVDSYGCMSNIRF